MTELYYRRKIERLEAVKSGQWRDKEGNVLDLYDTKSVPDAYLETIIISCEKREKEDNTSIDIEIVKLLQEIRKQRDLLRNKTKKMKTEQLELPGITGIETSQAAVAASTNMGMDKPSKPQMFKIGQTVKGREILNVEKSLKGVINGWVYTTKNIKTGKTERIKQSLLVDKPRKSKANVSTAKKVKTKKKTVKKNTAPKKFEESSVIREQFPRVRKVRSENGSLRYAVDARNNSNFPNGETEFYGSIDAAFIRAEEIEKIVMKNTEKAAATFNDVVNKAASVQPSSTESDIKKLPFFTKLKILFSTK